MAHPTAPLPLSIDVPGATPVAALLDVPADATALFVFAHGAGAGMEHAFMAGLGADLAARRVATLRFQFPSMQAGSRRPDRPAVAQAAVRAAAAAARDRLPGLPLFAGGKSFGGRMTTTAQAERPIDGVRGLVLVGFPLHPADKPGTERAAHLGRIACPMLFLQGSRDMLAGLPLLEPVLAALPTATLHVVDGADHAFHVPLKSGRTDAQVRGGLADVIAAWTARATDPRAG
jgi:uncharacterized protein